MAITVNRGGDLTDTRGDVGQRGSGYAIFIGVSRRGGDRRAVIGGEGDCHIRHHVAVSIGHLGLNGVGCGAIGFGVVSRDSQGASDNGRRAVVGHKGGVDGLAVTVNGGGDLGYPCLDIGQRGAR